MVNTNMMENSRIASSDSQQQGVDLSNTCMLVSDSNEIGNQLESKKLAYDTLVELAEDNLFKKYLDMTKYLTINQYDAYKGMLEDRYNSLSALFRTLPTPIANYQPKFRVVDGQVILLEASSIPDGKSPQECIYERWDITSEYQILPIPDCMLRGILDVTFNRDDGGGIELVPEKQGNEKVNLKSDNMPTHMHHSAVTKGSGFPTLTKDSSATSYYLKGNTVYDMFYNDSMDVGLSKNELDGTIDTFTVDTQGKNEGTSETGELISHDNVPKYNAFYGFVVQKLT